MSCLALWNKPSAVNQSWICPQDGTGCSFLYFQQLNRTSPFCGYGEAIAVLIVTAASIPANVMCVIDFYRRNVKRELLLFICTYAICNIIFATLGTLTTFARTEEDFIFGKAGCAFLPFASLTCLTLSIWSMTIIGFERRFLICNLRVHAKSSQRESRIWRNAYILGGIFVATVLFWAYPFFIVGVTQLVPIDEALRQDNYSAGPRASAKDAKFGCTFSTQDTASRRYGEAIFIISTFVVPMAFNLINYCKIWRYVRMRSKAVHYGKRKFSREIHVASIIGFTLILFIFTTMPFQVTVVYISYSQHGDKSLQSAAFYLAVFLLHVRTALGPLVVNFLRPATVSITHHLITIRNKYHRRFSKTPVRYASKRRHRDSNADSKRSSTDSGVLRSCSNRSRAASVQF